MRADPPQAAFRANPQSDEPGAMVALAGLLLVGSLVAAIMLAWYSPQSVARYSIAEGETLLYQGRYTEALAILEKALPFDNTPQTRLQRSYLYLARRDAARAEAQARAAISTATGSLLVAAWTQLGRVLSFAGREPEALDAWRRAVEAAPLSPTPATGEARSAVWHIAMSAWRRGDFAESVARLQDLLPGDDLYSMSAGLRLAQFFAPSDQVRSMRIVAQVETMLNAAMGRASAGDPLAGGALPAALPDLRVPGVREGLSSGAMESLIASLQSAFSEADAARKAGANNGVMAALWGSAYVTQGEIILAKRYLEQAVSSLPSSSDAHARLGLALIASGEADAALQHLQTAVQLDAKNPLPRHGLASIYMSRKEWDNAAQQLRTLRTLEPDAIAARLEVAEYYRQRGQYDEAEANLKEAAQVQRAFGPRPGDVDASLALARFYTDVRGQGCAKGLPAAQDSLALHPGDPDSLDAAGWSLVMCNNATAALKPLESAVAQAPEVPRFGYHLAKAYALAGRYAEARARYTRVMDLDPGGPWERLAQADMVGLGEK